MAKAFVGPACRASAPRAPVGKAPASVSEGATSGSKKSENKKPQKAQRNIYVCIGKKETKEQGKEEEKRNPKTSNQESEGWRNLGMVTEGRGSYCTPLAVSLDDANKQFDDSMFPEATQNALCPINCAIKSPWPLT